jgi:hypothetical protein
LASFTAATTGNQRSAKLTQQGICTPLANVILLHYPFESLFVFFKSLQQVCAAAYEGHSQNHSQ